MDFSHPPANLAAESKIPDTGSQCVIWILTCFIGRDAVFILFWSKLECGCQLSFECIHPEMYCSPQVQYYYFKKVIVVTRIMRRKKPRSICRGLDLMHTVYVSALKTYEESSEALIPPKYDFMTDFRASHEKLKHSQEIFCHFVDIITHLTTHMYLSWLAVFGPLKSDFSVLFVEVAN